MFVAFGSTVLVPLLVGFDPAIALLAAGLGTLLFHAVTGGKVPIYLGSSFAFIAPIIKATELYGMAGMFCGLVAVGMVYILMSFLVKLFGVMVKLIPVVFGALAGYIVAVIFYRSSMDFSGVASAPWFQLPHFSKMSLSWQAIVFMAPVAIAPIIEHVGDVYAISEIAGKDIVKDPGLHRTMLGDGLACTLAAFLGGAPVTTYSEVTGAVSLTKVTDPSCMRIAALSAILISLVGKVGAAIQTIPTAVLGGIMLLLFGSIASVGINNLVKAKVDMNKTRNLIIASLILTIGIGGAVISFGKFSLAGIGLASVVGVILNLVIPDRNEPEEVNA